MRIKAEQLGTALKKALLPVYLVSGDEPLQQGEAADAIRAAAKRYGYAAREVVSVETGGEWQELAVAASETSLFADKKLIDLRLPSAKPGSEGSKALIALCDQPCEETLLLITTGKLDSSAQKSQWFQAIDKVGAVVQVWPLQGGELQQWLQRRAETKGMRLEADAVRMLAARIEGNLLAAAQEIEKLYILHGPMAITKAMIENAVADSSRFDVFKLTDSLLVGRLNRAAKVLHALQCEGVAAPVVLWALAREARLLLSLKLDIQQGGGHDAAFRKHQVWDTRKALIQDALNRLDALALKRILILCAEADRQAKGQQAGDCWESLLTICGLFAADKQLRR